MQVVVIGMHRSGTSALTRVLGLMGCWLGGDGDFNPVEPDNPKGYWERRDVWALDEEMLASQGASWCRVADFDPADWSPAQREDFERRARAIVATLDRRRPWAIKDPRLCLLFPIWRAAIERPVCVIVHRRPIQVARSLAARDGFPLAVGMALWEKHVRASLEHTAGLPRVLVSFEELIADARTATLRLRERLGALGVSGLADPDPRELAAFIEPALWRARGDATEDEQCQNQVQRELYAALADGSAAVRSDWPPLSPGCDDLLRAWFDLDDRRQQADVERERAEARAADADARAADVEEDRAQLLVRTAELEEHGVRLLARTTELETRMADLEACALAAESSARELAEELGVALRSADDLRERARGAEARLADVGTARDRALAAAESLRAELGRAGNLFDQLRALVDLVLASRRYRFAGLVGETARRLTLRPAQPEAIEHARKILADYDAWRSGLRARGEWP